VLICDSAKKFGLQKLRYGKGREKRPTAPGRKAGDGFTLRKDFIL
jgi:hypothetical protein